MVKIEGHLAVQFYYTSGAPSQLNGCGKPLSHAPHKTNLGKFCGKKLRLIKEKENYNVLTLLWNIFVMEGVTATFGQDAITKQNYFLTTTIDVKFS